MSDKNKRHRLSLIIATLGPSTDNEKELISMIAAGIARQWTDGIDIARVVYNDGEDIIKKRVEVFRQQCQKRGFNTSVYLDIDDTSTNKCEPYLKFAEEIEPKYLALPMSFGIEKINEARQKINQDI